MVVSTYCKIDLLIIMETFLIAFAELGQRLSLVTRDNSNSSL